MSYVPLQVKEAERVMPDGSVWYDAWVVGDCTAGPDVMVLSRAGSPDEARAGLDKFFAGRGREASLRAMFHRRNK